MAVPLLSAEVDQQCLHRCLQTAWVKRLKRLNSRLVTKLGHTTVDCFADSAATAKCCFTMQGLFSANAYWLQVRYIHNVMALLAMYLTASAQHMGLSNWREVHMHEQLHAVWVMH